MKHTEAYRFKILLSMLERTERAAPLGVVERHADHVSITTEIDQHIVLTGATLCVNGHDIPLESITEVAWITREDTVLLSHEEAEQLKQDHFGRCHVGYCRRRHILDFSVHWITLDGLGQCVFPVMKYLNWAREHG